MTRTIQWEIPDELLLGAHLTPSELSALAMLHTAIALFRSGRVSSGAAAEWLAMSRPEFLWTAMREGAVLLQDDADDLRRESALLAP